jgi:hypothetical protein
MLYGVLKGFCFFLTFSVAAHPQGGVVFNQWFTPF